MGSQHTYVYDSICINISKLEKEPEFYSYIEMFDDVNLLYAKYINIPGENDNCVSLSKFHLIQEEMDVEISKLKTDNSECITSNSLSNNSKGFIFNVDTVYGQNNLVVLSKYNFKGNTFWGYSNIVVYVTFVSGFLKQNEYSITEGESNTGGNFVDRLYDYRRSLFGYDRRIRYEFIPFTDKTLFYGSTAGTTYNDFKAFDLLDGAVNYSGNKLQRYRNTFYFVEFENLYQIGPSGYVLVDLKDDDNIITEIFGEVEIKDDEDSDLHLEFKDEVGQVTICGMSVVKQGIPDGLQSNQFVIKPKDMNNFRFMCKDNTKLYINEILIPVRSNPDNPPPDIVGDWVLEDDPKEINVSHVSSGVVKTNGNEYTIENFNCSLIMAVGIVGLSGREISLIKIKLISSAMARIIFIMISA